MKKSIILLIILLSLFMIGAVSASSNDTVTYSSKLTKSISPTIDAGDVDISNIKNSEVKDDSNNVLKKDNSKKIIVVSQNNNHTKITHSSKSEIYKEYYDDYTDDYDDYDDYEAVHDAYIQSKKVYYSTDNEINFGWRGNLEGYFKIYKGNEQVYSYYLENYNGEYTHNPNGLKVGKYTTKIISDDGQTIAKGKIIVKKVPSKISVKSFKTTSGTKFTCYAYVYNKKDNTYLNEGYVKFKIKGKTYKAKVKNGEAKIKFKAPQKTGKYICKAKYCGTKNTKNSKTTKFKMIVKKKPKEITLTIKLKWNKYKIKRKGKYRFEAYKFKNSLFQEVDVFGYKNGKWLNRYKFQTKFHYKEHGKWKWKYWTYGFEDSAYHKYQLIKSIIVDKVKIKILEY